MARRAARVDKNQAEIVDALRQNGWFVQHLHAVGKGCPDLVISRLSPIFGEWTHFVEVKSPGGKLTPDQIEWHERFPGDVLVVHSVEELREMELIR